MTEHEAKLTNDLITRHDERKAALKARQEAAASPPSTMSLCLERTLYEPIQLNPDRDEKYLRALKYEGHQFDAYCVYCGRVSTFRTMTDRTPPELPDAERVAGFNNNGKLLLKRLILEEGQFALHLGCSRYPTHIYSYFFKYEYEGILTKIGQIPSVEDVAGADIERFRKILGSDYSELRKATGLFAHGIGIGSFVYLRRIFENLVENARQSAEPVGTNSDDFRRLRMSERITALADRLPPAVVKYKEAYSILSKGLHELSEDECKRYFPVVRAAVIMMLEQKHEAIEKAKAAADLERAVAAIAQATKI